MKEQFQNWVSIEEAACQIGQHLGLITKGDVPLDFLTQCMLGEVLIEFVHRLLMLGVLTRDHEQGKVKINPNYKGPLRWNIDGSVAKR